MWKKQLVDITQRAATAGVARPQRKAAQLLSVDRAMPQALSAQPSSNAFSTSAEALYTSKDAFRNQLQTSAFRSSLGSNNVSLRAVDDTDALLRQAEQLPFENAQEALCALLKAGEVQLALQLSSFWQKKKLYTSYKSRRNAKRELLKTIDALEGLKDAVTLKAIVTIFSDSLKEQLHAEKTLLQSNALTHVCGESMHVQNPLVAPLGSAIISDVLLHSIAAIYRLKAEDGVSTLDKLLVADHYSSIARSIVVPGGTLHVPFSLYREIGLLQKNDDNCATLMQQVCPELASKLIHPSHYSVVDILSLSPGEARYITKHWLSTSSRLDSLPSLQQAPSGWQHLVHRVFRQSPQLQKVAEKQLLLSLLPRKRELPKAVESQILANLRTEVVQLLRSPYSSVRRFAATSLLKRRQLATRLQLSQLDILSVYAQSFYSKDAVAPALCAFCTIGIRRLCKKQRFHDAATLAWNHLSVDCKSTRRVFRTNPAALEISVLSMSRAMKEATERGRGETWMGYRSLALLRHAAAAGATVTVLHTVPVCANALKCGLPFAAVNEFVTEIFSSDIAQRKWALDLIRICSETENESLAIKPSRIRVASQFHSILNRLCGRGQADGSSVAVRHPSRSKQLALWETVFSTQSNPRLNALMLAAFLSESVREEIVSCSFISLASIPAAGGQDAKPAAPTANDLWSWEVAASVASNCTTPDNYQALLRTLQSRRAKHATVESGTLDTLSALLVSEMDGKETSLRTTVH